MKERIHNIKQFTLCRKRLRKESTKAEKLLWYKIRNKQIGYKFRRQHGIGKYIVDFYCPDLKLIIESDGPIHWTKEQKIHDKLREKYLRNQGFIILRYIDDQIKSDLDAVLQDIKNHCDKIIIHNQPPLTPFLTLRVITRRVTRRGIRDLFLLSKEGKNRKICFLRRGTIFSID